MNGDGVGSPPWGPAEPVPEPDDTQAVPGLGPAPNGSAESAGWGNVADSAWFKGGEPRGTIRRASFTPSGSGAGTAGTGRSAGQNQGQGQDAETQPGTGNSWKVAADTSVDLFNAKAVRDAKANDDAKGGKKSKKGDNKPKRSFWREIPVLVVIALVLALLIKAFVIQAFWIPSGSMQNTLAINDRILINKVVYHTRSIHRGDIVVFDGTGSWDPTDGAADQNVFAKAFGELEGLIGVSQDPNIYIKRVIGLPGDHVVCCNSKGQVMVNGVALDESSFLYPGETAADSPTVSKYSVTVPAGELWVLGDHTAISDDSRGHMGDPGGGMIPESSVLGRAFVIIWPPSQWGFLNIPATFEQPQLNASNPAAAGGSPAALESAMDNGTPIKQTGSPIPLALGFAGAVPLTWLQRRARLRRSGVFRRRR
jgi:signal peptidase I